MKLLDLKTAENRKKTIESDALRRIELLTAEEIILTNKVNSLKSDEKLLEESTAERLCKIKNDFDDKVKEMTAELAVLESRRKIALSPIEKEMKVLKSLKSELDAQELILKASRKKIDESLSEIADAWEDLKEREDSLIDREEAVHARENAVDKAEEANKKSTEILSRQWSDYHRAVHLQNKEFSKKQGEIDTAMKDIKKFQKANEDVRISNESETRRLADERASIKDLYVALEKAKEHIWQK